LELATSWVSEQFHADGEVGAEEAGEVAALQEVGGEGARVEQPGVSHLSPTAPAQHASLNTTLSTVPVKITFVSPQQGYGSASISCGSEFGSWILKINPDPYANPYTDLDQGLKVKK